MEDSAYGFKVGNIYIRFDGNVTLVIYAENQEKEAELKAKMLENYYNFLGIDRHIIRCNWIN